MIIISGKNVKEKVEKYTKQQFLHSKRYEDKRDIINVILDDNKSYSIEEVESILKKFMKEKGE